MNDANAFARLVPGFDFLQDLAKSAGSAIPGMAGFNQWIAPTMDPAEIEKRIGELKTVQFWLEQNARMLATTIQALEVQKMTLSTLKTMNVQLGEAASAFTGQKADGKADPKAAAKTAPGSVVDPMQWWNALTTQFTELATTALTEGAADAAKVAVGGMAAAKPAPRTRPATAKAGKRADAGR